MVFNDMSAARLSDGRPQFLGGTDSGLYSTWKLGTDPDAAWSGWQPFPAPFNRVETVAAATLTDGRPQIFVCSGQMWSTWKLDAGDPDSAWADWTPFENASETIAVGTATLDDGRPQIFVSDLQQKVWSTWKADADPDAAWEPLAEFPSPGVVLKIVSVRLTDGRPQVLVRGDAFVSTWKQDTNPDTAWEPWQPFTGLPDGGDPASLAGTSRSDGLPVFVAAGSRSGLVWRTHKTDADPDAPWSDWAQFPPVGRAVNVAAASLTDGRPQILIDTGAELFTTWQADVSDPEKWVDPVPFDALPRA